MNFLHVSDLHIGRKLMGRPLIEDQRHILEEILTMAAREDIDAVLIAGDLYDKAQPSGEAIACVSGFLTRMAALKKPCLVISGNHDSPEQVAYCGELLSGAGIELAPALAGGLKKCTLHDRFGEVCVYLMPYLRPMQVRRAFPERAAEILNYTDAVRVVLEALRIDPAKRNVLLAHQYVTAPVCEAELTDSEERMLGGIDAVSAEVFADFDYVALGHLHTPQTAGSARIRYAGSPLKYSESEYSQHKAALRVTLDEKGSLSVEALPYHPRHDLRRLRGTLAELTDFPGVNMDYVFVTLTDELPPLDPLGSLLASYPNFVQMRVENSRSMNTKEARGVERVEGKNPLEHFEAFYEAQNNGVKPDEEEIERMRSVIHRAEEALYAAD